jgi:hypothetical protein
MPGKGLEFDAFASQGFKKEAVAQKAQPVANQERRSSYDYGEGKNRFLNLGVT